MQDAQVDADRGGRSSRKLGSARVVMGAWSLAVLALSATSAQLSHPASQATRFDAAGLDRRVAPGDDFDGYVNAEWRRFVVIPPDRSSYSGTFDVLHDLYSARTRTLLEEAQARPGSKIGDLYASYMDEAAADRKGLDPLRPWIGRIAEARDKVALAALSAWLQRQGVATLFTLPGPLSQPVSPDDEDPRSEVSTFGRAASGCRTATST